MDDRLGIRFRGNGEAVYHNRHFFDPYRAIADDLTLSRFEGERPLRAGEEAGRLSALLLPEQVAADTPDAVFEILSGPDDGIGLLTEGFLAAANFAPTHQICAFGMGKTESVPVFPGAVLETQGDHVSYRVPIGGASARLLRATYALNLKGDARIDALPDGALYVFSSEGAEVSVAQGDASERVHTIGRGQAKRIA